MDLISLLRHIVYVSGTRKGKPEPKELAERLGISPKYLSKQLNPLDPDGAKFAARDIEALYDLYRAHGGRQIIEYFARLGGCVPVFPPPIRATKIHLLPAIVDYSSRHGRALALVHQFLEDPSPKTRERALSALLENQQTTMRIAKALELWQDGELPF